MDIPAQLMPEFTLATAGSGLELDLDRPLTPLLLLFHDQHSAQTALAVNLAVRERVAEADDLLIASVVNMSSVPRLFRPMAQAALDKGYQDAAQRLPDGMDPERYILILPDWSGEVTGFTGFTGLDRQPGALLVASEGQILGSYQGPAAQEQILSWLDGLDLSRSAD